jgi:hypothetical protein
VLLHTILFRPAILVRLCVFLFWLSVLVRLCAFLFWLLSFFRLRLFVFFLRRPVFIFLLVVLILLSVRRNANSES